MSTERDGKDADLTPRFDLHMTACLKEADPVKCIAVGVSGGSDSMALVLLLTGWCRSRNIRLVALTVDHGLRGEAATEALQVAEWLGAHGVEHHILVWKGPHPSTGIQKEARAARYHLMLSKCQEIGAGVLALGHQLEDHLETLLMRLSKGSGLDGLPGMAPVSTRQGIRLVRPLLDFRRQALRDYLIAAGQDWIEDPSNESEHYTRTHLGKVLTQVAALPGADLDSMALAARRLQRANLAVEQAVDTAFADYVTKGRFGSLDLSAAFLGALPDEVAIRLLTRVFAAVRGRDARPRLTAVERLYERFRTAQGPVAGTLSGCRFHPRSRGWRVCREAGRSGLPVVPLTGRAHYLWDDRFLVRDHAPDDIAPDGLPLEIRRIGHEGRLFLKNQDMGGPEMEAPAMIIENLPAIWCGDRLVCAPLISGVSYLPSVGQGRFEMLFNQ
ncbi:tRNA lysidine(34) synthetase TilS [Sneathiella chinensis]|uniref:tRNA(Ile)-lysidine synthase n=1 Tax=Sneathiella chinensis TaxID=349750 RepID=A0ABQ5U2E5_9PROT|nr:tRNA lysidine(34) synthetase TilS [Sneathiella chinensis]GLQ06334.1 tRNA(Ile)-lysidine synthase [Sneathiella chinensis]